MYYFQVVKPSFKQFFTIWLLQSKNCSYHTRQCLLTFLKHLKSNAKPRTAQTIPSLEYINSSSSSNTIQAQHIFQILSRMTE